MKHSDLIIDFADWLSAEGRFRPIGEGEWEDCVADFEDVKIFTSEDLYKLYKKERTESLASS